MGLWKGLDEGGHPVVRYFGPTEEAHARAQGFEPATGAEAGQQVGAIDDTTPGALGAVGSAASSFLSGATLGASDLAFRGLLSEGEMARLSADRAAHPVVGGLGTLAGGLVGGPAVGLATRGGEAAGALVGGLGGVVARGAAEGAIFGAGQGVSEAALSEDPLTVDRLASSISSNAIYGAALGGGISLAAKGVEAGLSRAQRALQAIADRAAPVSLAEAALAGTESSGVPLERLDSRGLKAARDAELERLDVERVPLRRKLVEDINDFRDQTRDAQLFKATRDAADRDAREAGASLRKADFALRGVLDNRTALAENPERVLGILQRQEQALAEIRQWGDAELENVHASANLDRIKADISAGKGADWSHPEVGPFTPQGLDAAAAREQARRYAAVPQGLRIVDSGGFERALDANRALQRRIGDLAAAPGSPRLAAIEEAREALGLPKSHAPSIGGMALSAAAHAAGPLGTLAVASGHAVGALRKAGAAAAKSGADAIGAFLNVSERVTPKLAGPGAAAILSRVSFAPRKRERSAEPEEQDLPAAFKARTSELRELTMIAQDGSTQMRPDRRMEITRALAPVAATQPVLADRLETSIARRVAYMSSKIPKRPEVGSLQVGPDNWQPSELQMRSWARTVRACEDPDGVEHRLTHGVLTPEDAEAYRICYPARLAALQAEVFNAAPKLSRKLPTSKLVQLYTLTGVPTMPALQRNVFAVLQSTFAMEPGSAGGTASPKPMPSFGALGTPRALEDATPAQKRAAK